MKQRELKRVEQEESLSVFFAADSHFFHANIIKYCSRNQWKREEDFVGGEWVSRDVARGRAQEMTEDLIQFWNEVVSPSDIVYHLGDFCFGNAEVAESLLKRLNGQIHLVLGNHDRKSFKNVRSFASVCKSSLIEIDGRKFFLAHRIRIPPKDDGIIILHGHHHGTLGRREGMICDVGFDAWNLRPVSVEQVLAYLTEKG